MEITLLYVAGCAHHSVARHRIDEALSRAGCEATVTERLVTDATEKGFAGSPTILIDGRDPFASAGTVDALACRLYATTAGMQGAPTVDELAEVMGR